MLRVLARTQEDSEWLVSFGGGGPDSIPDQVIWDLWWTGVAMRRFFFHYLSSPCPFSFHKLLNVH
jgi:hypothetical protein